MKIIEKTNRNVYHFTCPNCGELLEANGKEFEFLRKGVLGCTCIACKEPVEIKERKIEVVPVYQLAQKD